MQVLVGGLVVSVSGRFLGISPVCLASQSISQLNRGSLYQLSIGMAGVSSWSMGKR